MKPIKKSIQSNGIPLTWFFYGTFWTLIILIVISFLGCKKENTKVSVSARDSVHQTSTPFSNTRPFVDAGPDTYVALGDTCLLNGVASDPENNIKTYSWKKISGPANYHIVTPIFYKTVITNLELGEYKFELKATDEYGLEASDTIKVTAIEPGQHRVFIQKLQWTCPMGCTIAVDNFDSFIPRGMSYLVFVREASFSAWQWVRPLSQWSSTINYTYAEDNNSLSVYANDASGSTDLKIMY